MEIFSDSLFSGIHPMNYFYATYFLFVFIFAKTKISCQNGTVLQTELGHMSAKTPVGSLGDVFSSGNAKHIR